MKRTVTIKAKNDEVSIEIVMKIYTKYLADFEHDRLVGKATDNVMRALQGLPYTDFFLSDIVLK